MRNIIEHTPFGPLCTENDLAPGLARTFILGQLEGHKRQAKPRITHMTGIPGAGKSTFVKQMDKGDAVVVSFDAIMESLPGYRSDKAEKGAEAAFAKWELCARSIGYELLFRALEKKLDVVFDHSGSREDHVALLRYLQVNEGYIVHVVSMQVDPETAVARAEKRDRHLPAHYIVERKLVLDKLIPQYMAVADVFKEFDTSDRVDAAVADKKTGIVI